MRSIGLHFLVMAAISLFSSTSCLADADITVYPSRVVFGDRDRSAQVDVINTSQVQAVYKISLVRKRMTETGEFKDVTKEEADERFADDLVKYSPRQITLLPGGSQTIRMMAKIPSGLQEGEYRSHLVFTKMPSGAAALPPKGDEPANTLSMNFTINVGLSIPVIVRHGKLDAAATIDPSSVKVEALEPKQQLVSFTLNRSGTRSIYGDATVYLGKEKIAEAKGLAVYTPNKNRKIALNIAEAFRLKTGDTLKVVFKEKESASPMAEATAVIP